MEQTTKGYKVTDENLKCRNYQFEVGKRFKEKGVLKICSNGFHFCELLKDCFEYYTFDSKNRVFEVVGYGKIATEGDKHATLEIEFLRELTWLEVLVLVNTGKDNTGRLNSGNWNSGYRNSGNWNSGYSNSGYRNSGYSNSGYRNSGDSNSGDSNSGNWNSGYRNSGNWNSGYRNSGNWNSGNWNSGYRNSGNWNSGDRNSGDSNSGYRNSGAFCTDPNPKLILFDVQTDILIKDWENYEACQLMYRIETNIWVDSSYMTPEEKETYPKHETTGGYLKTIPYKEAWGNFWNNLTDGNKAVFTSLPHFNAEKFEQITGIKLA